MSLDESYYRASGVRFLEHPLFSSHSDPTTAMRVYAQYANITSKSRAWIISLAKTSNGLFYEVDGCEMVIFPDQSYIVIRDEKVIDLHGQWDPGYVDRHPDTFIRKFV